MRSSEPGREEVDRTEDLSTMSEADDGEMDRVRSWHQ